MSEPAAASAARRRQLEIVRYCESFFAEHGDRPEGVGWPNAPDAERRQQVMLEVIRPRLTPPPVTVLDLGCGPGHMFELLEREGRDDIRYIGVDLSEQFIALCRDKFAGVAGCEFHRLDILAPGAELPEFDYAVVNGVFTSKCTMSFDESFDLLQRIISVLFRRASAGVAFNAMSKQVDWEREDLFHLPLDALAAFLTQRLSRHFVFRHDYGVYDFTTYVYHEPVG